VVGEIIPFNWPPIHTGGKLAPALAVGNTVVIKPSEQCGPPSFYVDPDDLAAMMTSLRSCR
jgi:hypothetical protein